MAERLEIKWSNESVRRTDQIIKYFEENWTNREINNFFDALEAFEEIVSCFPEIYPESLVLSGYRKAVILKQISIIYSVDKNLVKIHTLFDNRQDPSKLK